MSKVDSQGVPIQITGDLPTSLSAEEMLFRTLRRQGLVRRPQMESVRERDEAKAELEALRKEVEKAKARKKSTT